MVPTKPGHAANRFLLMETPDSKAERLLALAMKLRLSAVQTENAEYIDLFLRAAVALEARAIQGLVHSYH